MNPITAKLAAYLFAATMAWMHAPFTFIPTDDPTPAELAAFEANEGESWPAVVDRIHSISEEVAELVLSEQPLWPDDVARSRTGLLMMAVPFWETRFRGYVDDGRCNDPEWVRSREGHKRLAWRRDERSVWVAAMGSCDARGPDLPGRARSVYQLWNFDGDRQAAEAEALRRMRASFDAKHGLRDYTGEWQGPAPRATQRLATALRYARVHPYN
jgi:hypothetical protein